MREPCQHCGERHFASDDKCPNLELPGTFLQFTEEFGTKGECFRNVNRWNTRNGLKSDLIVHGKITNIEGNGSIMHG